MALFHVATITPSKNEFIGDWVRSQAWGCAADAEVEVIGGYRFDDPEGKVGMETHIVKAGGVALHVPMTYRDAPLDGADDALICTIEHSALGTRWVYDGVRDPRLVVSLAGVTMTGQGEALGMFVHHDRWHIAPMPVRIEGGGWGLERVPVDGFELDHNGEDGAVLRNDRFELTVFRRPVAGPRPPIALTATWPDQVSPVVLATVTELSA